MRISDWSSDVCSSDLVFVSADEGYDAFVESFGLSLLTDQIDEIKAIFTNPEVDTLLDQILRLDIRISCTEAIGLGIGRYMLTREVQPAEEVSMRLSGGGFCYLWNKIGLTPLNDGETVGELPQIGRAHV